ncbi:MFS transporter [Streptomyces xiaopingdaonensis]|uniref:MFS transporter n=1 Tax=Streptomyces xiaopingdaonensis TaxID=1565415 RepID=UPI0002DBCA8A|nr:MFS transporter [Streptomyces xiaopingdaonensis]
MNGRGRSLDHGAALRRRRTALHVLMLATGIGMASWVARTPAVRDALDITTGGMGLVLFGLSCGSMAGVLVSGGLVRRYGAKPVICAGAAFLVAGPAAIAAGSTAASPPAVFAALALFGAGMGLTEIAFNIEGAALEGEMGRPVLPVLHGCFSLGTVLGALGGMALTAVAFPVGLHLSAVALVVACGSLWAVRHLPAGTGRAPAGGRRRGEGLRVQLEVWRDGRLVLIGLVVLAMAFAEGSANDWLPLLMVDGHGVSATAGSLTFTAFAAAMTAGRFAGGPLLARFGRVAVVRASALTASVGLALVVFSPVPLVAGAAVVLWGLGTSLGFPVAISAAGDGGGEEAARVGAVATTGYFAFLVGPPSLGFLADHVGLRLTMLVILAMLLAASFLSRALRPAARAGAAATGGRVDEECAR